MGTFLLGALGAFIGGVISIATAYVSRVHESKLDEKRAKRERQRWRTEQLTEALRDADRLYRLLERLLPDENVLSLNENNDDNKIMIQAAYFAVGDRLSLVEIHGGKEVSEEYERMYFSCRGIVSAMEYGEIATAGRASEEFHKARSDYIARVKALDAEEIYTR